MLICVIKTKDICVRRPLKVSHETTKYNLNLLKYNHSTYNSVQVRLGSMYSSISQFQLIWDQGCKIERVGHIIEGLTGKFLSRLSEPTNSKSMLDPVNYFLYYVGIHNIHIFSKCVSKRIYYIYISCN